MMPVNPDSSPIVRGDFDTRRIDTVAWLKTPSQGRMAMDIKQNPAGGPPSLTMRMQINPFPMSDEWSLLSDGTVAIVRAHDYHIDWIDPDGSRRASPKMPIEWRRYTDDERRQRVDSMRKVADEQIKRQLSAAGAGGLQIKMDVGIVPDSEFPTFWPPIQPGTVLADLEGHLWILPTHVDECGERPHVRCRQSQRRSDRACAATKGSRAGWVRAAQCRVFDEGGREGDLPRAGDAHWAAKELIARLMSRPRKRTSSPMMMTSVSAVKTARVPTAGCASTTSSTATSRASCKNIRDSSRVLRSIRQSSSCTACSAPCDRSRSVATNRTAAR
jgi:hypothetical protein